MKLLICVTDPGNGVRAGEVVAAMPDSHQYGPGETGNPNLRVVSCDITEVEAEGLVSEPFAVPGQVQPWRRMLLDVADLPAVLTRAELYARVVQP